MLFSKLFQIFALHLYCVYSDAIRFQVNYTALPSVSNQWSGKIQTLISSSTYYIKQFVQLKTPNSQNLLLSGCGGKSFDLKTYTNVDFVIFVSILSDQTNQFIAYSDICDNGNNQPTSGEIVFNSYLMDQYFDSTHGYDHQRLLDVTIRELIHLLGLNQNLFNRYTSPFTLTAEMVYTHLAAIPVIKTPLAIKKAQQHFNCPTLTQIPVVQAQFGSGVNIFSSYIQSDIASNYIGIEGVERQLSQITLAILDDSGWYIIDYSYAAPTTWGKNKGCEFVTKSCQSTLNFPEFCYTALTTNQCSFDLHSIGKCIKIPEDADCLLKLPDQKSFQYPAQKLTCRNSDNNYPWTSITYETYSTTSGCFNSSFYSFSGDRGLRCYQYTCSSPQILISVNGNNLQCTNSEVRTLNGLSGQLQCPTSDQITQLCMNLTSYSAANYCSMRGLLTKAICSCDAGYTGNQCEQLVTCDVTCSACQTTSALSCTQCITGYTLIDYNSDAIGWCQQNSFGSCATNCSTCQTSSPSQCISCSASTSLAEVAMHQVGYCVMPISNCQRIQYNASGSVCYQCFVGYRSYSSSCLLAIAQCISYINQLCGVCQNGYHVSGDSTICVQDVPNCGTYSTDKLTCQICTSQYQLFNLTCYQNLQFCTTQNYTVCLQCNSGYHFSTPSCMPDIIQCAQYAAVINGSQYCANCSQGFIAFTNKCLKQIINCQTYTTTSTNIASTCATCITAYHVGNTQQFCYPDVPNCQTYTTNGDKCALCQANYDLTMYQNCYLSIQNCSSRSYMDDTLCATCVNLAYSLSSDQKSCSQPIVNCSAANFVNNTIICQTCSTGYHVSLSQTNCYLNISLCSTYNDTQCAQCQSGTILQQGVCYYALANCQNQTMNNCTLCNAGFFLLNNVCTLPTQSISKCVTYMDIGHCGVCNTSYALNTLNDTCYIPVSNCSLNIYNKTTQSAMCALCLPMFFLSTNQTQCIRSVNNCSIYTKDLIDCIVCNQTFLLDTVNNVCLAPIQNCLYRSTQSPFGCLQCQDGYQISNDTLSCYYCPIKYCQSCTAATLLGILCGTCQTSFQPNLQRNLCLPSCQVSYGLDSCLSCPLNQATATVSCASCTDGYYLGAAFCYACTSNYAHCQSCDSKVCLACLPGYYYDLTDLYCYSCSSKYGECRQCNSSSCLQCGSGSILRFNTCNRCRDIVPSCATCAMYGQDTYCLGCLDGYFYAPTELIVCISCQYKFTNCAICNSSVCLQCTIGLYLDAQSTCQRCDPSCADCVGPLSTNCKACSVGQVLLNGVCTSNLSNFTLSGSLATQAQLYASQQIQMISNMTFTQLGALDYKQYFCDSDSKCNMNGRCIVTQCKCITNLFGSHCQFTNTTIPALQNYQNNILSYLNSLGDLTNYTDLSARLSIMQTLSDTTEVMTDANAQVSIALLTTYKNKLANLSLTAEQITNGSQTLLNTLGSFSRYFQTQQLVTQARLIQLDDLLNQALATIAKVGGFFALPYQRVVAGNYDFKDPRQLKNFTALYSMTSTRLLQTTSPYLCNNDIRITKPHIQLTDEVISLLKKSQLSASTPLQIELAHFYYNPHVNSQGQTIDSAIYRAQFSVNGVNVPISNLSTSLQVLVPKIDQSFSDTSAQVKCLTWNTDKQIWDDSGIDNTLTVNCRFYVACYTNHLSDFGMQIVPAKNITIAPALSTIISSQFDITSIEFNSGFYLSLLWFVLFIFFWILFWCQYKRAESLKRYKDKKKYSSEKRKFTSKDRSKSKSPKHGSILKSSKQTGGSPKSPNTSRAPPPQLMTEQQQAYTIQIPIDQYLGQPSNSLTERNLVDKDSTPRNGSTMTRGKSGPNMWLTHPLCSVWNGRTSLVIKVQKLSLLLLQLQVLTAVTAGFLSVRPFQFGYLTVYFLVPILLSWFSNYFFGMLAVCFRRRNGRINCFYWFFFIIFELALSFVAVYCMIGQEFYFDLYLLFGVGFELLVDLILVDLFVTYFYQTIFEDNNSHITGFFSCIRFRGYYIQEKKK